MRLSNLKKVPDYRVQKWIEESIPNLTKDQRDYIRHEEIVRFSPFDFYTREKKYLGSVFIRMTVFFIPVVWFILFITLPFNFVVTGNWGYDMESLKWFRNWNKKCDVDII